ncbi:oplophorus-luciferin 2-monooxygenase non-catalytic subunit-like [Procambarus clarkii]|uniref:oplophorus-luciferin 2-monooxygenase non-catalytic subunit-like n=1 Tax=Procambarus clarkii TaxID=6728 RepID=UPI003743DE40
MITIQMLRLLLCSVVFITGNHAGSVKAGKNPGVQICPEAGVIMPCLCTVISDVIMEMDCSEVDNEEELAGVFNQNFSEFNFFSLIIKNNPHLKVLREGVLGNSAFKHIRIYDGVLEEVQVGALTASASTVTHLDFFKNNLTVFPFNDIPSFTQLQYLDLQYNNLQQLPEISSLTMETLYLSNNPLGSIPLKAFANTPAISVIHLAETGIREITPGIFSELPQLGEVDLWNNKLSSLPEGTFNFSSKASVYVGSNNITKVDVNAITGMSVGRVDISSNKLVELEEQVWHPLLDVGITLDPSDNPLGCDCDILWIIKNATILSLIHPYTTCADGRYLIFLNPADFDWCL